MYSTRLFLAPLMFTALWHVPLSFTMDNQSASQHSSTVDLRWAFAKMSHLVCATPETLHIKGAHKQGRTTASKVKLQQAMIHIFDALELLTDSQDTNVRLDLAKLEIFCAAVHECAKEVKSETHVCLDDTLQQLSQTPPEKVFIQGLPYQKKESQTAIVERICMLPKAISLQQDGTAILKGPLLEAFVFNKTGELPERIPAAITASKQEPVNANREKSKKTSFEEDFEALDKALGHEDLTAKRREQNGATETAETELKKEQRVADLDKKMQQTIIKYDTLKAKIRSADSSYTQSDAATQDKATLTSLLADLEKYQNEMFDCEVSYKRTQLAFREKWGLGKLLI